MAGDWIKIEENTPDKPEVHKMASILGIDPDAVVGKLVRVWSWASQNCNGDGVTDVTVKALQNRIKKRYQRREEKRIILRPPTPRGRMKISAAQIQDQ
jgi:hypothetical protein